MTAAIRDHLLEQVHRLGGAGPARRRDLVDALARYARRGRFPANPLGVHRDRPAPVLGGFASGAGRAPRFVDPSGVACAVGHLMRVSGAGELAAAIAARDPWRYVHEIDEPPVRAWAHRVGFTLDELARIQPAYGPEPTVLAEAGWEVQLVIRDSFVAYELGADHEVRRLTEIAQICVNRSPPDQEVELWLSAGYEVPSRFWISGGPPELADCMSNVSSFVDLQAHLRVVPEGSPRRGAYTLRTRTVQGYLNNDTAKVAMVPRDDVLRRLERNEHVPTPIPEPPIPRITIQFGTDGARRTHVDGRVSRAARYDVVTTQAQPCLRLADAPPLTSTMTWTRTSEVASEPVVRRYPGMPWWWEKEEPGVVSVAAPEVAEDVLACLQRLVPNWKEGEVRIEARFRIVADPVEEDRDWKKPEGGVVTVP